MHLAMLLGLAAALLSAQLAITHVTVIDPRSRKVMPNTTVVIKGGSITRVGSDTYPPRRHRIIDGRNQFLIPGLWDCHVHLTKAGASSLPLFIANGVTSVRDMGSDPVEVLQWRREIEVGRRIGPRIKTPGRILESRANVARMLSEKTVEPVARIRQPVGNPEEARQAVAELKGLGVDFLKIRTVADPETFEAIVKSAKDAGLALTGHPLASPLELIGKFKSVEHFLAFPPLSAPEADRRKLFRSMREAGLWMSSTAVNFDGSILVPYDKAKALLDDREGKLDARRKYIGGYLLEDWQEQVEERRDAKDYVDSARVLLKALYRDLHEMHQEGVKLLAGTDVGVALIYPGFHLHEELAIYARHAAVEPMEILRIATHNPAEFFNEQDKLGGIAPGQAADLVLLDRNPLVDITNTASIRAVVFQGKWFDRKQLDRLLRQTASQFRN
jgi:hypothetical protein